MADATDREPPENQTATLARRIVEDLGDLAREHAALAREEVKETAAQSAAMAAVAGFGIWMAAIGATVALVAPAASTGRTRRRMLALSVTYLLVGGGAALLGGASLGGSLTHAFDRTRRELKKTARVVTDQVKHD